MSQHNAQQPNSKSQNKGGYKERTPRKPRKITPTYLHNAGLYYLERFSSSSANFRDVMLRKSKRSCMAHEEQSYEDCVTMVDELVEKFIKVDLLDDRAYTRAKIISLRRKGKSARAIQGYLRSKGLDASLVQDSLNAFDLETHENQADAEYEAALTFARKKRLGPFRTNNNKDKEELFQKELGRMARAGFSYDTSRTVLEMPVEEVSESFS